jgi:dCTP deaminase
MTLLRNEALHAALKVKDLERRLILMPLLEQKQVGPASIDVRLGTQFRLLRRIGDSGIDPDADYEGAIADAQQSVTIAIGEPLWLHPGQFVLGATLEYLRFPAHLGGYVLGRSTWGRVGLLVATAIMIQPGFSGCLTLELVNHGESPIALYAGSRIAQLAVHDLGAATDCGYAGKYVGPTGPEAPRLEGEKTDITVLKDVAQRLASAPDSPRRRARPRPPASRARRAAR